MILMTMIVIMLLCDNNKDGTTTTNNKHNHNNNDNKHMRPEPVGEPPREDGGPARRSSYKIVDLALL